MIELSVAPMLKVTTPQFRLLMRKINPTVILFTEMIVANTVIYASDAKIQTILGQPDERTIVQVGGSAPEELATAVEKLMALGWSEFNLNCGCPSSRVQSGRFGAILMRDVDTVIDIINTVQQRTKVVLSLKIRTGVDELDSYEWLHNFVKQVSKRTPCHKFYIHARKCWLNGVNPKQNRTIPPLNYPFVYRLKGDFPHLFIVLNGGIKDNGLDLLGNLDGLMIGRYAVDDVMIFNYYNKLLDIVLGESTNSHALPGERSAIQGYLEESANFSCSKSKILLPLNNIRRGRHDNKKYRNMLSELIRTDLPFASIISQIDDYLRLAD